MEGLAGSREKPPSPGPAACRSRPGPAALTRGVVAVPLVSLDVLGPVAVRGVEEIDVLVVVAGQQLCGGKGQRGVSGEPGEVAPATAPRGSGHRRAGLYSPEPSWLYTRQVMLALDSLFT